MVHRWYCISWILFLSILALTSSVLGEEMLSTFIKRVEPSVVLVFTYDQESKVIRRGHGFFVSREGDVVTDRYLLEGADHAGVKTMDGMLYPARRVVAEDKEAGLIRLSLDIPLSAVHPLPVSPALPQLGERVIVIDRLRPEKRAIGGIVSGLFMIPAFGKLIQVSASLPSGASGYPLVNMRGEVVGIVTSRKIEGETFALILSSETIAKLLPEQGKTLTEWERERKEGAESLYGKGLPFLWKGDYERALPYFKKAVKKNPRYPEAYFQIGYCNAQLKRYEEAYQAYKQAIRIKPDFVFAHFYLGLIYLDVRDKNHALEEFQTLRDLDRGYADDLYQMIY
jgi:hypothetical protein